jgi:hypothetical protein
VHNSARITPDIQPDTRRIIPFRIKWRLQSCLWRLVCRECEDLRVILGVHGHVPGGTGDHRRDLNLLSSLLIVDSFGNEQDLIGSKICGILSEALFDHQSPGNLRMVHPDNVFRLPAFGVGRIDFVCG